MNNIELLASNLLAPKELELAKHLAILLGDNQYDVQSLVQEIIPIYWEHSGNIDVTLSPDSIYRSLYYIHTFCNRLDFKEITRDYVKRICSHLEACLLYLTLTPPSSRYLDGTFGSLIAPLNRAGKLTDTLAGNLRKFNEAVNISSKHPHTYMPARKLNERTFSVLDAAYSLVIMRKLSKELFGILKSNGVLLPQDWPEFKDEWLTRYPKFI